MKIEIKYSCSLKICLSSLFSYVPWNLACNNRGKGAVNPRAPLGDPAGRQRIVMKCEKDQGT